MLVLTERGASCSWPVRRIAASPAWLGLPEGPSPFSIHPRQRFVITLKREPPQFGSGAALLSDRRDRVSGPCKLPLSLQTAPWIAPADSQDIPSIVSAAALFAAAVPARR